MKRIEQTLFLVASLGLVAACGGLDDTTTPEDPASGGTSGGEDTTFDHDNASDFDPFDVIRQLEEQGPPRFTARVHGCVKMRYATLGNVLASYGVNVGDTTPVSAGQLYTDGDFALGAPNYPNRIRENLGITTSGSSRMFDVFAAAADQVIAAVPTLARCTINGTGAQLFDPVTNQCRADGISCLLGVPAQAAHLDFCNLTITGADDVATGKRIAVAALLAAANTCE